MSSKWLAAMLIGISCPAAIAAVPRDRPRIEYHGRTPEGLAGNGHSVVKVRPGSYEFHTGGDGSATFRLILAGTAYELAAPDAHATFFPGGVVYRVPIAGMTVEVLHGALSDVPYLVAIRVTGAHQPVELEVESRGAPALTLAGRVAFRLDHGSGELVFAAGAAPPAGTWEALRERIEAPYCGGLLLQTPSPALDRAVPFCRFLLDLGFDGRFHVCEIFRWRDVWSRDLGSGLVPGALASGRYAAARTTIGYDLHRYATSEPRGLKVTQDPSQGGTAEGTAWLTRAVWRDFLLTGDKAALASAAPTLRPWVEAWIDRDPDDCGLLVDVSEWMDHSRFFLFPDGARVLYSNVLFVELLNTFAKIETVLGNDAAARRYEGVKGRFIRGINAGLWDEANGVYDNLSLWGRRDERVASAENALAVLCGVAPIDRARRALAAVRAKNWRPAGSTTIVPPMSHVPESNDHNYKMWPWWNAVEARARFRTGDVDGGVQLLERCAATLEDEHYPGLMEELTTPDGMTEGGNAFLTAAGSYLDAVLEGLLGIEILEPGCARLRVAPNVPASWRDWSADVPLPEGSLTLQMTRGQLRIRVTDPRVKVIEAPPNAEVEGAVRAALTPIVYPVLGNTLARIENGLPASSWRNAAVFSESGLPGAVLAGLPSRRVSAEDILSLERAGVEALIIPGNALPYRTPSGGDVPAALARYLDHGGALVFYGATMHDRGTMGEYGGVVDWYDKRPVVRDAPISGWKFRSSPDNAGASQKDETGLRSGWHRVQETGPAWKKIPVPAAWEAALGREYDAWGWYRAYFTLPADARGEVIVLSLGRVDDQDWTFVNGHEVGSLRDSRAFRRYRIRPGDPAYQSLVFGGDNVVAVQVLDTGGAGGLCLDTPRAGFETADLAWSPIDPKSGDVTDRPLRHGVVSWGPGGAFFNSWETSRGAFGFTVQGHGVDFVGPLAGIASLQVDVGEAFTDFAVSRPWRFEPLAYTETHRRLLVPDQGERYPCAARLVNTSTGGEFILIPASIAAHPAGLDILKRLRIGVER